MSVDVVKNVVEMVFQNQQFEKNVETTLKTLDKLKEALKLEDAVRGLENIGQTIKNTSMDSLYNSVGKVSNGFNALEIVAVRVLQRITDKVLDVGSNLVKKVTVAPLKAGLEEYETQINSVQTILANTNDALIEKGLTTEHDRIEKINGVLDELNHYADMTIYNFTEMTRNIGTFTAAGVELDTAATSIKGIANLAAMSGSNSQQASTAMYQLSQAIASGSVKLQDWNSVVNAGMGGKLFQNELIDTAKAMGVVDSQFKSLVAGTTTFRESLSSGWISAEVLTNTLEKFTAGSEGYTKSQVKQMKELWEARGYSQKQIEELTGSITVLTDEQEKNLRTKWAEKGFNDEQIDHILSMGTAATDAATKVKTFTQLIETVEEALQSGWTQSWEYIIGDFEQAKRLWTEISDIMNLYIGKSADARNSVLKEWSRATYSFNDSGKLIKLTYDEAGNVVEDADEKIVKGGKMLRKEMGGRELVIQSFRNTFQGLFEVAMEFGSAWDSGFWGKDTERDISITAKKLKDLSLSLYDYTDAFKKSFERNKKGQAIGLLGDLRTAFDDFSRSIRTGFDGIAKVFSGLGNILKSVSISKLFSIDTLYDATTILSTITGRIKEFGDAFSKHFGNDAEGKNRQGLIDFTNGLVDFGKSKIFTKLDFFTNGLQALGSVIEHIVSPFGTFSEALGKVGEHITTFSNAFDKMVNNEDSSKFEDFFSGLASSFNGFIDTVGASVDFSGFEKFFSNLVEAMTSEKLNLFGVFEDAFSGLVNILKALVGIATPVVSALADVFGDWIFDAGSGLSILASRFKDFTQSLVPNEKLMTAIQHVFSGLFNIITSVANVVGNVLLAAWDGLLKVVGYFLPDSQSLADTLTNLGDTFNEFADQISSLISGEDGVPKLGDLIGKITDKFIAFFGSLKDVNVLEKLGAFFTKIGNGIKLALGGTEDMTLLDTLFEKLKGFLQNIHSMLSDDSGNLDFVKILEAGGIGVAIKKLIDFFKELKEGTGDFQGFLGIFGEIKDAFKELTESLGETFKTNSIKTIARSILEIAAALFIISMIDPMSLTKAVAALAGVFDLIDTLLISLKGFGKQDAAVLGAIAAVIQTLGNSILLMAVAIAVIGNMEFAKAVQGLVAVGLLISGLVVAIKQLGKIQNDLPKVAGALISLGIALNLLVIPIKALGGMDLPSLAKGLIGVGLMLAGLVASAVVLSDSVIGSDLKKAGAGLVLMAFSIKILASAVEKVSNLSWEQLAKGLVVMAAGLIAMVGAAKVISDNSLADDMMTVGGSLIMLGIAMMMLSNAANGIASVSWEDLGKMAAVLAGALIALGLASHFIDGKNLLMIGGAIFLVATAISQLTITLNLAKIIGPICTSISAALSGISNSLLAFSRHAAAQSFLQFLQDIILFLPKLAVSLAKGLVDIIVVIASSIPDIIGAIGGVLVSSIVSLGQLILEGLTQLLPSIFSFIKAAAVQICGLIIALAPMIANTALILLEQFMMIMSIHMPIIANLGMQLVVSFIDGLANAVDANGDALLEAVLHLIESIVMFIVGSVGKLFNAAGTLIKSFVSGLSASGGSVVVAGATMIVKLVTGIFSKSGSVSGAGKTLTNFLSKGFSSAWSVLSSAVSSIMNKLVSAISNKGHELHASGSRLVAKLKDGLKSGVGSLFSAGADAIQGFINGMSSKASSIWNTATSLAQSAWDAVRKKLKEKSPSRVMFASGVNFALGFINGSESKNSAIEKSSRVLAQTAIDAFSDANLPDSKEFELVPVFDKPNTTGLTDLYNMQIPDQISVTHTLTNIDSLLRESIDTQKNLQSLMSGMTIDYTQLGNSIAQSLINSGIHVEMDSGQLMGYLAGEIRDARRMFR